jgi:hypothetical protein
MELTSEEKTAIEWTKEGHPEMRHRQLLGILQNGGLYLSFSFAEDPDETRRERGKGYLDGLQGKSPAP